jgi:branched-chain amino acid transport system ATP-binding protein
MSNGNAATTPILQLTDVHTYYGSIHALKGISLEVHEGEIVTLLGANGAGKSTTLRSINGLKMGAFQRKDRGEIKGDMDRVFELFPRLHERRTQKAGTMSGGEQQMCAIGRALMARPKLLLLDEPSLGLAPIFVERIFDIIKQINAEGTSILLVEQNALMALDAAHRGYVLETGRIVLADSAESLKTNEQVRKTYLGET